ncbi:MAG: hypothetical protein WAM42_09345, partial [Candidatus Nitrosopolaris sp.]
PTPQYIVNNPNPNMPGTLVDAGTPVVAVRPRAPLTTDPGVPRNFPGTQTQYIGKPTDPGW